MMPSWCFPVSHSLSSIDPAAFDSGALQYIYELALDFFVKCNTRCIYFVSLERLDML